MARIIGHFDGLDGTRLSGWALDEEAPERVLTIAFLRADEDGGYTELGRVRANRPRPGPPAASGEVRGHGFEWRAPFPTAPYDAVARIAETGSLLEGGPARIAAKVVYEGHFDDVERGVVRGWARAWNPSVNVMVEIFIDGRRQGAAPARTERPDLVLAHVGDGRHAFAWVVPERLADDAPHEFACRIGGTDYWLPGGPKTIVLRRGERTLARDGVIEARGHAPRPSPHPARPERWYGALRRWLSGERWQPCDPSALDPSAEAAAGNFWRPLPGAPPVAETARRGGARLVRLLVPVWGADYIDTFCRNGLASFLSPNNLPALAQMHPLEVVFLTRQSEFGLVEQYPAYLGLAAFAKTSFIAIDDILARYFDPGPHAYAQALTYAFFRGITTMGDDACDTDFLFWNADFVAADGTFRTLAELIAAGIRCTYAPSLRVDREIETEELDRWRSADGAVLDIEPRKWVSLAARFRHPTVRAQTINRHEERMIDTVNQLYWEISDELMVGRVFLMFMLHIRPERVWDELYGHCDYTFVPEMLPSGDFHVETLSDRVLIIELQHHNREWQDIVSGDAPMTAAEVARGINRWTTREHRATGRHMVVFNSADSTPGLATARRLTDAFMDEVYAGLTDEPIWHNGHFYWNDSLASLNLPAREPGPDHPRSHLAAALRWTGYDIDILRESWPDPAGPPTDLFGLDLPLPAGFDAGALLAEAHARYFRAWQSLGPGRAITAPRIDIASGHFEGFGWGLAVQTPEGWGRCLGPDGRACLLLRLPRGRRTRLTLFGAEAGALAIHINGRAAELYDNRGAHRPMLRVEVTAADIARGAGLAQILFCARPETRVAISWVEIKGR